MSKQEQVLILEPSNELRFRGPFREVVTRNLKLTNPTSKRVGFKVKTTAPKRYCVRPNCGVVEPLSDVSVAVMLQPFEYEANEKNKHKFMVQTMFAPDGDISHEALWRDVTPDQLMDSKLKCVFELPADMVTPAQAPTEVSSTTTGTTEEKPRTQTDRPQPKASNIEAELKRAAEEVKRLREENSSLRRDFLQLKEENTLLRKDADTRGHSPQHTFMPAPQPVAPAVSGFMYLMALLCVVLGVIIAKIFI